MDLLPILLDMARVLHIEVTTPVGTAPGHTRGWLEVLEELVRGSHRFRWSSRTFS